MDLKKINCEDEWDLLPDHVESLGSSTTVSCFRQRDALLTLHPWNQAPAQVYACTQEIPAQWHRPRSKRRIHN